MSVSCSVKRKVCGLCGREHCSHEKGKEYPEGLGHLVLLEPTDAYECSFVAVPAQREAGVTKSFLQGEREAALERRVRELEEEGPVGGGLPGEPGAGRAAVRRPGPAGPARQRDEVRHAGGFPLGELSQLGKSYQAMVQETMPLKPQLAPENREKRPDSNGEYRI